MKSLTSYYLTIPNLFTICRITLTPLFLILIKNNISFWALGLYLFILSTDYLDGFFARKLHQESKWGALFDPIADKWLIILTYFFLLNNNSTSNLLIFVVIFRNFAQLSSIPILLGWLKRPFNVKPKLFPKIATALSFLYPIIPLFFDTFFTKSANPLLHLIESILIIVMCCMEIVILLTFLPRFYLIARGKHDTFE